MHTCLAGPPAGEAGALPAPPALPALQREHAWREDRPVSGLAWLDGPALAVACEAGPRMRLRFYDAHSAPLPMMPAAAGGCVERALVPWRHCILVAARAGSVKPLNLPGCLQGMACVQVRKAPALPLRPKP